jgi:hypothetical protein
VEQATVLVTLGIACITAVRSLRMRDTPRSLLETIPVDQGVPIVAAKRLALAVLARDGADWHARVFLATARQSGLREATREILHRTVAGEMHQEGLTRHLGWLGWSDRRAGGDTRRRILRKVSVSCGRCSGTVRV